MSILIVEDEALVAEDLAGKLRRLGYEVAGIASEGEEAVAIAQPHPPGSRAHGHFPARPDGRHPAAEEIRRQHDVPIVYLTAHSDPATLARASSPGPSDISSNRSKNASWPPRSRWLCTGTKPTGNSASSANCYGLR